MAGATLLLLAGLATGPAVARAPERYPDFDWDTATSRIVIATLEPGGIYPEDPCADDDPPPQEAAEHGDESAELDTICIPYFTLYWLDASIHASLLGEAPPGNAVISSSSHYGMPEREELQGTSWLVHLLTDGTDYVLPGRERHTLAGSRGGESYLLLTSAHPPDWLPCAVENLREEISAADFAAPIGFPREALEPGVDETNAPYLRFNATGVEPRYGISMTRLRAYLATLDVLAGEDALECESR